MSSTDIQTNSEDLGRVVSLNDDAKLLLTGSFEINLGAFNAIVLSKRSGGRLRGFDEVSSQIRTWSRELHARPGNLGHLGREAIEGASVLVRLKRLAGLLGRVTLESQSAHSGRALEALEAQLSESRATLRATWRRIFEAIDDLNQVGLMACVLSRSAMIEATAAEPEAREQFGFPWLA